MCIHRETIRSFSYLGFEGEIIMEGAEIEWVIHEDCEVCDCFDS